ncbi:putative motility protein [Hydrogenophaga sp. MI9]|uniref:putative motility protein n=1 Tax=Hydrogenophaga sp. MI9 TaxID=3453719 RepID=UPI003EEDB759
MDIEISPALLVDRVVQSRQGSVAEAAQVHVLKKAMDLQESASATLLNSVAGSLPLASGGSVGTKVNAMV